MMINSPSTTEAETPPREKEGRAGVWKDPETRPERRCETMVCGMEWRREEVWEDSSLTQKSFLIGVKFEYLFDAASLVKIQVWTFLIYYEVIQQNLM